MAALRMECQAARERHAHSRGVGKAKGNGAAVDTAVDTAGRGGRAPLVGARAPSVGLFRGLCLLCVARAALEKGPAAPVVEGAVQPEAAAPSRAGPRVRKAAEASEAVVAGRGWENGPPGHRRPPRWACPQNGRPPSASSPQPRGTQAGCPLWARGRASGQAPLRQKEGAAAHAAARGTQGGGLPRAHSFQSQGPGGPLKCVPSLFGRRSAGQLFNGFTGYCEQFCANKFDDPFPRKVQLSNTNPQINRKR